MQIPKVVFCLCGSTIDQLVRAVSSTLDGPRLHFHIFREFCYFLVTSGLGWPHLVPSGLLPDKLSKNHLSAIYVSKHCILEFDTLRGGDYLTNPITL